MILYIGLNSIATLCTANWDVRHPTWFRDLLKEAVQPPNNPQNMANTTPPVKYRTIFSEHTGQFYHATDPGYLRIRPFGPFRPFGLSKALSLTTTSRSLSTVKFPRDTSGGGEEASPVSPSSGAGAKGQSHGWSEDMWRTKKPHGKPWKNCLRKTGAVMP